MKKTLSFILFLALHISVFAQWNSDVTLNNLVCNSSPTTAKSGNVAVSDGAGGMFIAWIDSRTSANQSIYVQRILSNGSLKFASEVLVTQATGTTSSSKSNLTIDADGAGGVVLVWQDARNTTAGNSNNDIYGQRVDANGNVLWAADGIRMTVADNLVSSKITPVITKINSTEAIVTFGDNRAGNVDIYAQKILLSTGATKWASDVSIHGSQPGTQTSTSAIPDGANGVFIVWQDPRLATTNSDIYAQRLDNNGNLLWGASGTAVCTAPNNQLSPQMVSDGDGGIVITWADNRAAAADGDIWAQRLNGSGAPQWAVNGVAVCIQVGTNQSNPYIIAGGSGYILTWSDPRAAIGNRNLYVNSIDNDGVTQWTTAAGGGIAVCTATGHQPASSTQSGIQLISDGNNGAILIWDDARNGTAYDIYAQRINSVGEVQWAADGVVISSAAGVQQGPVAVSDASNNPIIAWRDGRNGTSNTQIFASKLLLTGALPITFINISAITSNNEVIVNWKTGIEINTDLFVIERSENALKFEALGNMQARGISNSSYTFKDTKPFTGDVFYRIKSIDKNGVIQYSRIVKVSSGKQAMQITIYPNPTRDNLNLQFSSLPAGKYKIRFFDTKGANVFNQDINLSQNIEQKNINIGKLNAGGYFIQITDLKGIVFLNKYLQKF